MREEVGIRHHLMEKWTLREKPRSVGSILISVKLTCLISDPARSLFLSWSLVHIKDNGIGIGMVFGGRDWQADLFDILTDVACIWSWRVYPMELRVGGWPSGFSGRHSLWLRKGCLPGGTESVREANLNRRLSMIYLSLYLFVGGVYKSYLFVHVYSEFEHIA